MTKLKHFVSAFATWWLDKQNEVNEKEASLYSYNHEAQLKREKFANILDFTDMVMNEYSRTRVARKSVVGEHPVINVIRLLGKKFHYEYCEQLLLQSTRPQPQSLTIGNCFFGKCIDIDGVIKDFSGLCKKVHIDKTISLGKDVLMAWPWSRERLSEAFAYIGEGKIKGSWNQDGNHIVTLLLPVGISFVEQGNHSIASGMIQGEGVLKPTYVLDISPLYEYVYTDGAEYYLKSNNDFLCSVKNVEFAAIFEIGRKMMEHNISF